MKLRIGLLVLAAVLPEYGTTRSKPQASQCMRMKPRQDTAVQGAKFALDEAGDFPIPFPLFGEEGFDVSSDGPLTRRISIPGKSVTRSAPG